MQYIRNRGERKDIWRAETPCRQLTGPRCNFDQPEEKRSWLYKGLENPEDLETSRERWWLLTQNKQNNSAGQMSGAENESDAETSIYCAQVLAIEQERLAAHLVFRFAVLRCWGDVACKVLRRVGWTPTCGYEDTR